MALTDKQYLEIDLFDGDRDVDLRMHQIKLVTVRKPQICYDGWRPGNPKGKHTIKPGQKARFEKALIDGEWGSFYVCLSCLEQPVC